MKLEQPYRDRRQVDRARALMAEVLEIAGRPVDMQTARLYLEAWLKRKAPEVAEATLVRYKGAIGKFLATPAADKPLEMVTREDILDWRAAEAARTSSSTAMSHAKALGVALSDAAQSGLIPASPAFKLPKLKNTTQYEDEDGRQPFTEVQMERLLAAKKGTEWEGVMRLGADYGTRIKDAVMMEWAKIDLEDNTIRIRSRKTSKTITLPLMAPLAAWLAKWRPAKDRHGRVFPTLARRGSKAGGSQVSKEFRRLLVRLKMSPATGGTGSGIHGPRRVFALSFHSFRHTATSRMKAAGVPEAVVMEIIGHESKAVNRHYTHVSLEQMREALQPKKRKVS
jgi:integrase